MTGGEDGSCAPERLRRSLLYVPGDKARALDKARTLACDGVILDLEDAVPPEARDAAREAVAVALVAGFGDRETLVRTNAPGSAEGRRDLALLAQAGADGLVLPKIESADELRAADALLERAGAPDTLRLWAMMETPRAILEAAAIAGASPRLAGFVMGTNDLARSLGAAHLPGRAPLLASLSLALLAARSERLAILDSVFADLGDEAGLEQECRQGAAMGFDGKTVIHPRQIAVANRVFRPSREMVETARRLLACWREAEAAGRGVALFEGRMIERLHAREAARTVALDAAAAARDGMFPET